MSGSTRNLIALFLSSRYRMCSTGTVLRVAGNANRIPSEAFNPVMAALGLHVDQGTTHQALAIDKFSCLFHLYFVNL
jgi:hypothetical protein